MELVQVIASGTTKEGNLYKWDFGTLDFSEFYRGVTINNKLHHLIATHVSLWLTPDKIRGTFDMYQCFFTIIYQKSKIMVTYSCNQEFQDLANNIKE
jgi:hypothetical protein